MKKWITTLHVLLACVGFSTLSYAQPANDACGSAISIPVNSGTCSGTLYTNDLATSVGDPAVPACWTPNSLSHSVWFSFMATTTDIEISTNFAGTLDNTQLAVYSGTCGSLVQIACQENINTATNLFHTDVILRGLTVNNTYYLLVDGNGNTTGTFGICAQETLPLGPQLPTQDCTGAQTMCSMGNIVMPNGAGGTGGTIESPSCFGSPGERSSNWYTFTAATSGTLAFTITPTTLVDYDFAVYNTTNSCPGAELSCNWEEESGTGTTGLGCGTAQCEPTLTVVAGQTYTILVDRYTPNSADGFTLNFAGSSASFTSPNPTFINTTACIGAPTQFTNTTNGNFTYSWNFGDGSTSNLENPAHTYAATGNYNVTLLITAAPGGCQNAITKSVTVNGLPTVDAGIGGNVCPANCLTLAASTTATGINGPISFSNTNDYPIADDSTAGLFDPILTSGVYPAIIGANSIASVCLNITHTYDDDLDIFLECPDGTRIQLSTDNGGAGNNYTNTCFTPTGTAITAGTAPFTGNFQPEQSFNLLNGCSANGTWRLFVRDDDTGETGTIRDWTITFNNNLPPITWSPTTGMTNASTLTPTVCPTVNTTYTLTVNNSNGCTASDTVSVNIGSGSTAAISCGTTTATSIDFTWGAVTNATSYTLSYQVGTNPIINMGNIGNVTNYLLGGLAPGNNVSITLTPVGGTGTCFTPSTKTCTANACTPPVTPILNTTAPTCSADGFTTITNYDATATYTFTPNGPTVGALGAITAATAGTAYTVTATKTGCTSNPSNAFTNLARLATPPVPSHTTTPPTCTADGVTSVTNYDPATVYTFSPTGLAVGTLGVINGATVGTPYTITATKGGCTSTASAPFTNLNRLPTPITPTFTITAPTCAADGFTTLTNYDPAATYAFTPTGPAVSGAGLISGALVGNAYTVTATKGGCTSPASNRFTNLARLVTPATPIINTTPPTCAADGFTTITNYDPAATYTFTPTGPTAGALGAITGATVGTSYTVTATKNTCISNASASFSNLVRLVTPSVPTHTTTPPTCAADGFTTIANYDPAATYTFAPSGPTVGSLGLISGATVGTSYTITATKNTCTSNASTPFTNGVKLVTPAIPTLTIIPPTCAADGFSTITNYDPATTYTFTPNGPTVGALGLISGAGIGTAYTITATKNTCTSNASAPFTNLIKLVTPPVPTLATTPPGCFTNGSTAIANYDPATVYTFSPIGPTAGTSGAITGATIGTAYTVTATKGGCTSNPSSAFTNAPLLFNVNNTSPAPLQYCDPNNDGIGIFDLTQVVPSIIGTNPYTVTFHETPTDAAIGGTFIPNPATYENIFNLTGQQTIYIRVIDNATQCFIVIPMTIIVNPTPVATEPNDYHTCDNDQDGFAVFNLASVSPQVFGALNQSNYNLAFYTSLTNAQTESNPITTPNSYTNTTINNQTIWIRVENNATGCYDIVTLELIVDPLPLATQPNYPQYNLCDTTLPVGYEQFDLGSKINGILLGQTGMKVTFHFSQADAVADANPLPLLYTNTALYVQTIWIRIENAATHCFVLSTMDIRVEPLPSPIPPNAVYTVCDNNQDGYSTFNLNMLTASILQGANYTITYHETNDDAIAGNNPLASPYDNIIAFSQFIYVLAVDNSTRCRSIIPIELGVEPQPITPFTIPDITKCDEDSNPQDAATTFDLTQNDAAVLIIQNSPPTDYTVTYYISQTDAIAGIAPIIQSSNYFSGSATIWVRVENNLSHCFSTGSFQLIVNSPLPLTTPTPLNVCDSDAVPNNLYTQFDLTVKDNEINQGTGYTVTYYPAYPVTASSVAIPNPTAYTNITPAVQTLGVMVTNAQGCKSYTTLDIRVLPIPVPNGAGITPLPAQCDVNNTGDMMEVFDLTVNESIIKNNDPSLTLHYYPTQADALAETNEILAPTNALVGQNVWIRVENTRVDYLGTNCFVILEQPLTVNPLPATLPSATVQNCDDDTDGQTLFDLTITPTAFYTDPNLSVTYYISAPDAQLGTNPIATPTAYTNVANPQIIFIRVVNTVTGCVNYNGQFTIIVNPKPTATAPANFQTCDTDGTNDGIFALDLSTYISGITGSQTGMTTTFYNSQTDAVNATNPITDPVNYQTYTHILWIRVENTTTGCYQLASFTNTVEQLAEPNITSPSDTICVEYGTNALLSGLTLDSGITNPNYTFQWSLGGTAIPSGTNSTYQIISDTPGDYTVVATSTSALACVSNVSNTFTVIQSGPALASSPAYTVTNAFDDNQVITINVVGFGLYEYSLDEGPFQSSNVFEHVNLGGHTITIKDVKGNTSCGEIAINDVQTINYPHYFTPNGDGYNDTWNVVGLQDQLNARLYIFDRQGKLLKQLSTSGQGWDGTYNGNLMPSTDYWFKVEYLEQSLWKEFRSHFTLKR